MSIISDALKKAQAKRSRKGKTDKPVDAISLEKNPEKYLDVMIAEEKMKKPSIADKRRLVSILGALVVVLLLGGAALFLMTSRTSMPQKAPEPIKRGAEQKKIEQVEPASKVTPTPPEAEAETKRPKYIPVVKKEPEPEEEPVAWREPTTLRGQTRQLPTLSGIMYAPTNPQAILDGDLYTEGETVRGFKVQKILPNKVKLTADDKEYELRLR
ncbi:MAG: hypothetical protein WBB86_04595 [Candidatus Omnitrophota bacterium]